MVSADREWLMSLVPKMQQFLCTDLGIELHQGKLNIEEVHQGVEYLGSYIRPYRTYISNHALLRIEKKVAALDYSKPWRVVRSVNSYLGIMQHTESYKIRCRLFKTEKLMRIGFFDSNMTKFVDRKKKYGHIRKVNQ